MQPPVIYTMGVALTQQVAQALNGTAGGRPSRVVHLTAGEIVDDACCDGGQLALTVPRTFGALTPPVEAMENPDTAACGMPYLVTEALLRLTRCAPAPGKNGASPDAAALERAALVHESDRVVLRDATRCKLRDWFDGDDIVGYQLRAVESVGPGGGCVAVQLRMLWWTVQYGGCDCHCSPTGMV